MTDSPISLLLEAVSAIEAGDVAGVESVLARYMALGDQVGAHARDLPGVADPMAPFSEVLEAVRAGDTRLAKAGLVEALNSFGGFR